MRSNVDDDSTFDAGLQVEIALGYENQTILWWLELRF